MTRIARRRMEDEPVEHALRFTGEDDTAGPERDPRELEQ